MKFLVFTTILFGSAWAAGNLTINLADQAIRNFASFSSRSDLTDIRLTVGPKNEILHAHSLFLMAHSTVFASDLQTTKELRYPDISAEVMKVSR
jgi:hypothetical protein